MWPLWCPRLGYFQLALKYRTTPFQRQTKDLYVSVRLCSQGPVRVSNLRFVLRVCSRSAEILVVGSMLEGSEETCKAHVEVT